MHVDQIKCHTSCQLTRLCAAGHGHSHGLGECKHSHGGHGHAEHSNGKCHGHGHSHGHSHNHEHGHKHGHSHGHDLEMGEVGHGHGHGHKPKVNLNEWSMYLHVMGDALGSAFVVANACIIKYGTQWGDARLLADPITSLVMVFIIMIQTVPLIYQTCHILLEMVPPLRLLSPQLRLYPSI